MFGAIPNAAGEVASGKALEAASLAACGAARRMVPRPVRRLVIKACLVFGPRALCASLAVMLLILLLFEDRRAYHSEANAVAHQSGGHQDSTLRGGTLAAASAPSMGVATTTIDVRRALHEDFTQHPTEYWRMLLPGQTSSSEVFYDSMLSALRARPLGRPCLDYALEELAPQLDKDSLWLEFGVWMGRSLNMLSHRSKELGRKRKVFGFDSFKGLPETWRNNHSGSAPLGDAWARRWTERGAFDLGGRPPEFFVDAKGVEFVVGWFNESLPRFLEREKTPVSFVHVDCDLYSSAILVLRLVTPRLRRGSIIVFDEIINWPGFRGGEARALQEWLQSPEFRASGLAGVQVIGYRGPHLLDDDVALRVAIKTQHGEGRRYPQDAVFRVW